MRSMLGILLSLNRIPIPWASARTGAEIGGTFPHSEHTYAMDCAICRFGDRPEAQLAVISTILDLAERANA